MKLARPTPGGQFILQTDASKLYQEGKDGERRIISLSSVKFKGAEKSHINEAECYATV